MTDLILTPMAEEQEYTILCCVLNKEYPADDFVSKLNEDDFVCGANKYIFNCIKSLASRKKEVCFKSLLSFMRDRQKKEPIPVMEVERITKYYTAFYDSLIPILKEKSARRKILRLSAEIQKLIINPENDTDFIINEISQTIAGIDNQKNNDILVHDFFDVLKKRYYDLEDALDNNTFRHGIYCGINSIDEKTGGFLNGDFIVIGARPSMGKSALMGNMAVNIARDSDNPAVLMISIEMKKEPIANRILSSVSQQNQNIIKYGHVNNEHLKNYAGVFDTIASDRIYICDKPAVTVAQIKSIIRKYQQSKGVGIVLIDYMGKIRYANLKNDEYEGTTQVSNDLKECARDLNIPIICLSQLNREVEKRTSKRPIMSDLKASGAIEADADFVGLLYRPGYYGEDELRRQKYDINDTRAAELVICKSREGSTGIAALDWYAEYSLFTSRN